MYWSFEAMSNILLNGSERYVKSNFLNVMTREESADYADTLPITPQPYPQEPEITPTAEAGEIKLVSSNVRCWSPYDIGKRSWFYRAGLLMRNIEAIGNADVIGFQEVTKLHYKYLCDCLPGYDSVITYRDKNWLCSTSIWTIRVPRRGRRASSSFWIRSARSAGSPA